jgi:hypothetical protein
VKLTKRLKIDRINRNDIMEKLIKGMSKLVLIAIQAVTEKITIVIK